MATNSQIPIRHQNRQSTKVPQLFRLGGSGFTAFHWEGQPIMFARTIADQSPQPVAAPVPIHPMDQRYPIQILTPAAIGVGTLTLEMWELYGSKIWDRIMAITDTVHTTGVTTNRLPLYNDLAEVFVRLANIGRGINATKLIYPPNKVQKNKTQFYADTYHNCVITDIRDDEAITVGSMDIAKTMTVQYTNRTRHQASV